MAELVEDRGVLVSESGIDLFITQGISFFLALKMLFFLVPSLLAFAVPMAVLMGILAGMSRLSTDSTVERLARTGIAEFERFMEGAYRTKKGYDEMWEEIKKNRMRKPPEFSYVQEETARSFRGTLLAWALLPLMSLLLFALARTLFIRKDVR